MIGARVNGKLVPIDYEIQNGDRIEVLTSQNSKGPSRDWLSVVKSTQAKSKINQWFRNQFKDENITKGKEMLAQYCKIKSIVLSNLIRPEYQEKVMHKYGFKDWESVLAAVGHGGLKEGQVINKLQDEYNKAHPKIVSDAQVLESVDENNAVSRPGDKAGRGGIIVKGAHDVAVRYSKCCSPVPGDEIVGFVTRGRGISIHRTDCINIINLSAADRSRLIEAEWQDADSMVHQELYSAEINIYGNNRSGLLVDVSKVLTERKIDIKSVNVRTSKQGTATINMSFDIRSTEELRQIIDKLRQIDSVLDVERAIG